MSFLWWLQPGWTETCCGQCGARIYPQGDPDWGLCVQCFDNEQSQRSAEAEHWRAQEEEHRRAQEAENEKGGK